MTGDADAAAAKAELDRGMTSTAEQRGKPTVDLPPGHPQIAPSNDDAGMKPGPAASRLES